MKIQVKDWIYVIRPGRRRGFYGWVFTIEEEGFIHCWDPKRRLGHRIVHPLDSVTLVCRNVRLKKEPPAFVRIYSNERYRTWQTLENHPPPYTAC